LPSFIIPAKSIQRPSGVPRLNYGSPQALGLVDAFLFGDPGGFPRSVRGAQIDTGTAYWEPSIEGVGASTRNSSKLQMPTPTWLQLLAPVSIVLKAVYLSAATSGWGRTGVVPNATDNAPWNTYTFSHKSDAFYLTTPSSNAQGVVPALGTYHCAVGVIESSGIKLYQQGILVGTGGAPATLTYAADTRLLIGSFTLDASSDNGVHLQLLVYNRPLSAAEAWSHYDPRTRWDLYYTPSNRVYINAAAAAAGVVGKSLIVPQANVRASYW
jgi:hypothetical protein